MLNPYVEGGSSTFVFTIFAALIYGHICFSDWFYRRIPNLDLLLLLSGAVPFSFITKGMVQTGFDLLIGLAILLVLLPLYRFRKMGAGDVKLLVVTAFLFGEANMAPFAIWLVVSTVSICMVAYFSLPKLLWMSVLHLVQRPDLTDRYPAAQSIPYGIPISLSAIMCLFGF